MLTGELVYLIVCIVAFAAFVLTLACADWFSTRKSAEKPAQPAGRKAG